MVILGVVYSFFLRPHYRALFLLNGTSANCICGAGAKAGNQVCCRTRPKYYTESPHFSGRAFPPSLADDWRLFQTQSGDALPGLMHICFVGSMFPCVFLTRLSVSNPSEDSLVKTGWQKLVKCQFNLLPICLCHICCECAPFTRCIFTSVFFFLLKRTLQHSLHASSVNKSSHNARESMVTTFLVDVTPKRDCCELYELEVDRYGFFMADADADFFTESGQPMADIWGRFFFCRYVWLDFFFPPSDKI